MIGVMVVKVKYKIACIYCEQRLIRLSEIYKFVLKMYARDNQTDGSHL